MKQKFLAALVDTYRNAHQVECCGIDELIYNVTEPYCKIICSLLEISDDDYSAMLNEALDITTEWEYKEVLEKLYQIEKARRIEKG